MRDKISDVYNLPFHSIWPLKPKLTTPADRNWKFVQVVCFADRCRTFWIKILTGKCKYKTILLENASKQSTTFLSAKDIRENLGCSSDDAISDTSFPDFFLNFLTSVQSLCFINSDLSFENGLRNHQTLIYVRANHFRNARRRSICHLFGIRAFLNNARRDWRTPSERFHKDCLFMITFNGDYNFQNAI